MKFIVQQINKKGRTAVLVGCIKFLDLLDKVKISFRDYNENGVSEYYQRRVDKDRTKEIAAYIEAALKAGLCGDTAPIFPTSIILSLNEYNKNLDNIVVGDIFEFKELANNILIVDGQHRYSGMKFLYEKLKKDGNSLFGEDSKKLLSELEKYSFNCSVLLNYDIWQQAQVFASVNFNQKKVNKSLFYDIYGIKLPSGDTFSIPKHNDIYIAHKIVEHINQAKTSPFSGFVKMLGSGDGYVSQAFLVEQILRLLAPGHIWYDVSIDVRNGGVRNLQNYCAAELTYYLYAIKVVFPSYWPNRVNEKPSVLCRTTGMGAMIRFLEDLHNCIDESLLSSLKNRPTDLLDYVKVLNDLSLYFEKELKKLEDYEEILFNPQKGEYGFTGGAGLQSKLYNKIKEIWNSKN